MDAQMFLVQGTAYQEHIDGYTIWNAGIFTDKSKADLFAQSLSAFLKNHRYNYFRHSYWFDRQAWDETYNVSGTLDIHEFEYHDAKWDVIALPVLDAPKVLTV